MPLTNEQKSFLIFKEFTGFSDACLFESDEELRSKYIFQKNSCFSNELMDCIQRYRL